MRQETWDRLGKAVKPWILSNGVAIPLFVVLLRIDGISKFVTEQTGVTAAVLLAVEAAMFWGSFVLFAPKSKSKGMLKDTAIAFHLRFGQVRDYPAIRDIHLEYFPAKTLMDPAEYRLFLTSDREIVRIIEVELADHARKVIGYYSVWPIAKSTFADLAEGKLRESATTGRHLLDIAEASTCVLYVAEICVSRSWRETASVVFVRDLQARVTSLIAQYPCVESVHAWAYTDDGMELAGLSSLERMERKGKRHTFFQRMIDDRIRESARERVSRRPFLRAKTVVLAYDLDEEADL